jgi:hypothetical protein
VHASTYRQARHRAVNDATLERAGTVNLGKALR